MTQETTVKVNKTKALFAQLCRPEGASLEELANELKWKVNSIRGAMSVLSKKNPEFILSSEILDGVKKYFLKPKEEAPTEPKEEPKKTEA